MKRFTSNKIMLSMATLFFTASVFASTKGIDTSTGYAKSYNPTGKEMTLDFDSVNWNVVNVSSASQLKSALSSAKSGDKIVIASGTYSGNFKLTKGGAEDSPIWIVGKNSKSRPTLKGTSTSSSTGLAIDGDKSKGIGYIYIQDIKVTKAKTGISLDQVDYSTLDNVEVYDVGQAGIHLRDGSSHNIVKDSKVHDTGLYDVRYGEGIYIGSDYTKWPGTSGSNYEPAVDYNQILNNKLGPNVTAEHIDIKEGSSYSYIISNTFDAKGMDDFINGGLSFIDFKGNYAEAAYNKGDQNSNKLFENAFEINEKVKKWGYRNTIHDNTITFDDKYYDDSSYTVSMKIPYGSKGKVTKSDKINRDHWVVENNVNDSKNTNVVYKNTRKPKDANKMYTGDLTEN